MIHMFEGTNDTHVLYMRAQMTHILCMKAQMVHMFYVCRHK